MIQREHPGQRKESQTGPQNSQVGQSSQGVCTLVHFIVMVYNNEDGGWSTKSWPDQFSIRGLRVPKDSHWHFSNWLPTPKWLRHFKSHCILSTNEWALSYVGLPLWELEFMEGWVRVGVLVHFVAAQSASSSSSPTSSTSSSSTSSSPECIMLNKVNGHLWSQSVAPQFFKFHVHGQI